MAVNYIPKVWVNNITDVDADSMNHIENGIKSSGSNLYTNVQDYGALGNGVANDTVAIQSAINAMPAKGVLFFPATGSFYSVSTLSIPKEKDTIRFLGAGMTQSCIHFSSPKAISLQAYECHFTDLTLQGAGIMTVGSVIISDDRGLVGDNSADFDVYISRCFISEAETVVKVIGRGVIIENCSFFNIRYHYIKADFPALEVWVDGPQNTQYYTSGMRGYIFRNNRSHYCPATVLNNTGTNAKFLSNVLIIGNQVEGSMGYVEGYVRNMVCKNNVHVQCGNVKESLFMFNG